MMKAQTLKEFDKSYEAHRQAFLNMVATGKRKNGKPLFKKFKDLFDYDKELAKAKQEKETDERMIRMREYLRGKK